MPQLPSMSPSQSAPAQGPFDFLLYAPRVRANLFSAVHRHTDVTWDVVGHLAAATSLVILRTGREGQGPSRKRPREA